MSYDTELAHITLTWRPFTFASWAGEEAVNTFWLRHHHREGNPWDWEQEIDALPERIHDKMVTHWTGFADQISSHCGVASIKAAHIGADGHDLNVGGFDVTDGSLNGDQGGTMLPPEVALCISSWAYNPGGFAFNKGRKRGRFYLPYISSSTLNTDGRVDHTHRDNLATAAQALFNDLQGMEQVGGPLIGDKDYWDYVVTSRVDATWENVDFVSVDDKYDAQRRRQHQVGASRMVLPISHA